MTFGPVFITLSVFTLTGALLLPYQEARAASSITWDGGGDGYSFSDPLNWDTDAVPTASDSIIILSGDHVTLDVDFTISQSSSIELSKNSTLSIFDGKTLTIANSVQDLPGFENAGTIHNYGGTISIVNSGSTYGIINTPTGILDN
jgi:hypothetical protein